MKTRILAYFMQCKFQLHTVYGSQDVREWNVHATRIGPFIYATYLFKALRTKDQGVNADPDYKGEK